MLLTYIFCVWKRTHFNKYGQYVCSQYFMSSEILERFCLQLEPTPLSQSIKHLTNMSIQVSLWHTLQYRYHYDTRYNTGITLTHVSILRNSRPIMNKLKLRNHCSEITPTYDWDRLQCMCVMYILSMKKCPDVNNVLVCLRNLIHVWLCSTKDVSRRDLININ